ncbi:MAG: FMN-binding protein [Clostridia bacterium]|nr:FMN-binding protein [Clostridia bacterium]
MNNVKPTIVLSCICMAVALILSGINMITGPIIEAQRAAAANGALLEVMPDGTNFEELDISTLGLPEAITNAYKETSGKGYVFRVVSTGYKSGMVIMVGVNAEGKITGSKCLETQDTFGKEPLIDNSYNGQSLADFAPNLIAGATMTSNGYRDAVNNALQSFTLASGGKLDPAIALEAKIAEFAPGFVNPAAIDASGSFKKILKAANDAGFAYISSDGENGFLTLVNATGGCIVYDAEGNNVTDAQSALAEEAKAHAAANQKSYADDLSAKITKNFADASDITSIEVSTFGTLVSASTFKSSGADYYAFYSRSMGFHQMDVYVILDANGAIAKIEAKQYIFDEEYFAAFGGMDIGSYKSGFEGLTSETWTGDAAVIATATMTSNAMKQSTEDAFAAFNSIKGGVQ